MSKKLDKDILIHRISRSIIKLSEKFHDPKGDSVVELYQTHLAIGQCIDQEMERIRRKQRGEIA